MKTMILIWKGIPPLLSIVSPEVLLMISVFSVPMIFLSSWILYTYSRISARIAWYIKRWDMSSSLDEAIQLMACELLRWLRGVVNVLAEIVWKRMVVEGVRGVLGWCVHWGCGCDCFSVCRAKVGCGTWCVTVILLSTTSVLEMEIELQDNFHEVLSWHCHCPLRVHPSFPGSGFFICSPSRVGVSSSLTSLRRWLSLRAVSTTSISFQLDCRRCRVVGCNCAGSGRFKLFPSSVS